jgi:cytidylate kinase
VKQINIAIDGFSSCGKSTVAQALARDLKLSYVDSGAMYRAVTLYAIHIGLNEINFGDIVDHLNEIDIKCKWTPQGNKIYLNNIDITDQIRTPAVQNLVSQISTLSAVRAFLVKEQKEMAIEGGVIMDGRDIGTKVLPEAELKIFMTADPEIRAERRMNELRANGIQITKEEVLANLQMRDHIDSTRSDSPLKKAEDARVLDNSHLTMEQQLILVKAWAKEKMH